MTRQARCLRHRPACRRPVSARYGAAAMSESSDPAGIDGPAVTAWYARYVPDAVAPLQFDRVAGGHSCLTYIVTDAEGHRTVLRARRSATSWRPPTTSPASTG